MIAVYLILKIREKNLNQRAKEKAIIAEKIFKPKMMKNKNVKLFMIWLLIFLVITTLTFLTKELTELGKNMWVMLPAYFAILILGCNLPQGFVLMPNDPPHFGIVTRLGRRLWKRHPDAGKVIRGKGIIPKDSKTTVILTEGWNWIPFRRILYGVRMINMSKRSIDLDPQTLITPDQVTTDAPSDIEDASEDAPFIFKTLFSFSFDPPPFPPPPPFSLFTYLLTVKSLIESSLDHQPPPYELGFPAPKDIIALSESSPLVSQF
jgi:hypothetical protein